MKHKMNKDEFHFVLHKMEHRTNKENEKRKIKLINLAIRNETLNE